MENFLEIVGSIADIVGIISLPWALIQIFIIKSRIKTAQKSMDEILIIKEYHTLSQLSGLISRIQEELSRIILQHGKKGVKQDSLFNQCQSITDDLSKCITDTPSKHEELTTQFICCKNEVQEYINTKDLTHLKDAQSYVYSCIRLIKDIDAQAIKDESERIAKNS